ncbi:MULTISPECIES: hypothetical protein [Bacteria]|nr:hypothetical protein [Halomonas sp. 328]MBF8224504.1 hypothetical protein [Halomonas sp. 328]
MLAHYQSLNAISTIMGLIVAVGALMVFEIVSIAVLIADYEPTTLHTLVGTLVALIVALAASDTRDWGRYSPGEKVVSGVGLVMLLGLEWSATVQDLILGEPVLQVIGFLWTLAMWLVVSR